MSNRSILGPLPGGGFGLLVTLPGNDVTDPNLTRDKFSFDSRWVGSSIIVTMGTVNVPTGSTTTVNYGRTLPEPPVVIGMIRMSTGARQRMGWYQDTIQNTALVDPANVNPLLEIRNRIGFIRIYNNRFELPPTPSSGLVLEYVVMQRT